MDDQFLIGHADESGDVHARFPSPQPVGAMLPGFNRGNVDWFPCLCAQATNSLCREEFWRYLEQAVQPGDPREMREVSLGAEP
jgi:hypothetical protein